MSREVGCCPGRGGDERTGRRSGALLGISLASKLKAPSILVKESKTRPRHWIRDENIAATSFFLGDPPALPGAPPGPIKGGLRCRGPGAESS